MSGTVLSDQLQPVDAASICGICLARVWRMKTTSSNLLIYVKDLMKPAEDVLLAL